MIISVPTGKQKIVGTLKQKHPTKQLIVVCNGLRTASTHPTTVAITNGLFERGHAVFTFNSSDTYGFNLERQVQDVLDIIDHFKEYTEFILMGASLGALCASIAAHKSPKIKGLVTINGFFGSGHLGGKTLATYVGFRLLEKASARHKKFWQFYRQEFHPEKLTLPALIIHSRADKNVLIRQSRDFFDQLAGPKEFRELKRSDHEMLKGDEIGDATEMIDKWARSV